MNTHSQRLLDCIKSACDDYLARKNTIDVLQLAVAGNASAFEEPKLNQLLEEVFDQFDREIELVRFLYPSDKEYDLTCQIIESMLSSLCEILGA